MALTILITLFGKLAFTMLIAPSSPIRRLDRDNLTRPRELDDRQVVLGDTARIISPSEAAGKSGRVISCCGGPAAARPPGSGGVLWYRHRASTASFRPGRDGSDPPRVTK